MAHLDKMISWWEKFETDGRRNSYYKIYLKLCCRILRDKPLMIKQEDTRYKLRSVAITILDLIQQKEPLGAERPNQQQVAEEMEMQLELIKTCFSVIMKDGEDNAEIAFKIVESHINRLTRKEDNIIDIDQVKDEVLDYCRTFLRFLANDNQDTVPHVVDIPVNGQII